ncbi:Txe/YoeB family addiction module toxin [Francisella noatunensis]|uniref:Txe/YoeB family addiction module toxin n=1 Tax=Francisella noatunensis TaxID=657445 RepID=UPI001904E33D|nr:Txe/YoeB family addiction module toxin [Francisella noatunensis]MBK2049256.1 Txe/YoeB family addiction module toxin [Francisella noatunensis]MBK2054652.1 Txe/YoeB family addiction module toxin [Francisella noatunensis]MBK2059370.1 Txe/YoeB family addiction module toxin [Francisella noatunensis]MBK2059775.1 Txe/YoeB family addiction module toxin [Francisella noatunensis]MBK2065827.1 Txe/YoeB family addiction module toxin [Francisella noatunensis]
MILAWSTNAWEDYLYWQSTDKKKLKRINQLIKDINRNHFDGLGDPEPLKHNWSDYWSRRIDREQRIVYKVDANTIFIAQCRFHY